MKIPDNFVLLIVAVVCIGIGYALPDGSAATQMLAQFWAILLVMIQAGEPILPSKNKTEVAAPLDPRPNN